MKAADFFEWHIAKVEIVPHLNVSFDRHRIKASFSEPVMAGVSWPRWEAGKHLVFSLVSGISEISQANTARAAAQAAAQILQNAVHLHETIQQRGIFLVDETATYQDSWRMALCDLLQDNAGDFDFLELLT